MKPRTLKAYPILAVALTAAVPAFAGGPPGQPDRATQPAEDPKLDALQRELEGTSMSDALKRVPHFRPLCDKNGYPLVGNTVRKGDTGETRPSAFCAEVRKLEKRS